MVRNGQVSYSPCIWMSVRPIHGVAFLSCWFTLKGVCCCCGEIWSKRTRVFEDDVFIENTRLVGGSKTQDLNLRADLVLNMSRGPPGQWFPETEYWASAIFVGTSGIPPKLIYRSVMSYTIFCLLKWRLSWLILLFFSFCQYHKCNHLQHIGKSSNPCVNIPVIYNRSYIIWYYLFVDYILDFCYWLCSHKEKFHVDISFPSCINQKF